MVRLCHHTPPYGGGTKKLEGGLGCPSRPRRMLHFAHGWFRDHRFGVFGRCAPPAWPRHERRFTGIIGLHRFVSINPQFAPRCCTEMTRFFAAKASAMCRRCSLAFARPRTPCTFQLREPLDAAMVSDAPCHTPAWFRGFHSPAPAHSLLRRGTSEQLSRQGRSPASRLGPTKSLPRTPLIGISIQPSQSEVTDLR